MGVYRSPWIDGGIAVLHHTAREFFEAETAAHGERWARQQHVDREMWLRAGERGLLCAGSPKEYGGGGGTVAHDLAVVEAQAASLESGFGNPTHSGVVARYLLAYGTEEQRRRWLPGMATGELIGAIAITEPEAGSDLAALGARADRDGDGYVLTGTKAFVSNGSTCDLVVVAARTDPAAGLRGISLLVVEAPAYRRSPPLRKIGMKAQDTADLVFERVRVPAANRLGREGSGFGLLMRQLAHERLVLACWAATVTERAVTETVRHSRRRRVFAQTLFDLQNTRMELAECATAARVTRVFVDSCVELHLRGGLDAKTASMAKWWATETQCQVVDRCLQMFGGSGYLEESPIARMYVDARVQKIYGGANEVLKELIAWSL